MTLTETRTSPLNCPTPVICGPTAGGKSDLAVSLALALRDRFNTPAEIVTADAFQIYRGMDIGTAKPTVEERRGVPHHLIDLVDATARQPATGIRHSGKQPEASPSNAAPSPFTLQSWLTRANFTLADIRARNALPIVVGGTHLYIKALLEGLFEGPEPDPALRAELAAMDPSDRRAELERVDPAAAQRIHPNDIRRTIRALEVHRLTGKPITAHQTQWDSSQRTRSVSDGPLTSQTPKAPAHAQLASNPFLLTILDWETEPLNRRINARVKDMFDRGLPSEIRALLALGPLTPQAAEALGYKQLIPVIQSAGDSWPPPAQALTDAGEAIKIETRRFAKNQRTWLRRLRTTRGAVTFLMPGTTTSDAVQALLDRLKP